MIAQTTPTPVELAAWLGCLAFVVALVNGLMKLVDRIKDKPHPGDVRSEAIDRFASRSEFEAHVRENRDQFSEFAKQRSEDLHAAALSRKPLHDGINKLGERMSALEATNKMQTDQLVKIEEKQDGLADRIIATLRNTKARFDL